MEERLQKILAKAGIASRRGAEELISQGRVRVDGRVVTEMGLKVDPEIHRILCDNKPVVLAEKKVYILLNKPAGYVTTLKDPQGRPVVTSLLTHIPERVFPVGRLDLDTEGALLLTNDGDLAQQIQHPGHETDKTYEALVVGQPTEATLDTLRTGIMLEGRKTWPAAITVLKKSPKKTLVEITIHEGRKRQVKKMFAAVGHRVLHLTRTAYGRLRLGKLPSGHSRILTPKDLSLIFKDKNPLYKS